MAVQAVWASPQSDRLPLSILPATARLATAAYTFTVNSTLDESDASPGNGQCLSTPSGKCTLRAAMEEANHQFSASTTIILPTGTYTLTHGQLYLSLAIVGQDHPPVTILGADARQTIIDGNRQSRLFRAYISQTLNLSHLMLRDGLAQDGNGGGAIYNEGTLNLTYVEVTDNAVTNTGAYSGGGLYNNGRFLTIYNSSIHNNRSTSDGGGFYDNGGGDIFLVNSTLYENSAYGNGGGIRVPSNTTAYLYFDTIYGNQADYGANGYNGGGIKNYGTLNLFVEADLIEGNCSGTCFGMFYTADDCKGDLISEDYNVIATTTGCTIGGATLNNHYAAVSVQTFTYNGGDTQSLSIPSYSYARDKVPVGTCQGLVSIDQRGAPRLGSCDIGAFEFALYTFLPLTLKH
jgi:CSLREA domain-containing protein